MNVSEEEKNPDGSEKEITYGEYVDKINRRALEEQKKIMQAKMRGQLKKSDDNDAWRSKWFVRGVEIVVRWSLMGNVWAFSVEPE